jgi:protein-disulfide isomerase
MTRAAVVLVGGCLLSGTAVSRGYAQTPEQFEALRKQIELLVAGQKTLEQQVQEIRALVRPGAKPAPAAADKLLSVDGAPTKGSPDAKVTVVVFSDYECPFCSGYARESWPLLEQDYVKTGKIKYVFRNFPLTALHKQAMKAHEAALCAGEQGKYWEMHDLLSANSPALGTAALVDYAGRVSLKQAQFQACLNAGHNLRQIWQDVSEGQRAGVTGTPTFFMGLTPQRGSSMQALRVVEGAQPYPAFKQAIDGVLALASAAGR